MTDGRDSHVATLLRMTRVVFTHWDNYVKDDMVVEYPSTVVFFGCSTTKAQAFA